jgi:hypothetical protein
MNYIIIAKKLKKFFGQFSIFTTRINFPYSYKNFADFLKYKHDIDKQDVLNYPENYFGPNYKEVLNYWFYRESFSEEQRNAYLDLYWKLDYQTRSKGQKIAKKLASEVIDPRVVGCIWDEPIKEIIATHLYIERNIPFTFLPLIFDL